MASALPQPPPLRRRRNGRTPAAFLRALKKRGNGYRTIELEEHAGFEGFD
jgi:hypothetical protein